MRRRNLMVCVAVVVGFAIGFARTDVVRAGGYWNMPGTLSQRAGHGYSGGYHAPFLLGPIRLDGWGAPNEVRLPCSPDSTCACACGCECYRMMDAPSTMEGVVPTPAAPTAVQRFPARAVAPTVVRTAVVAAPKVAQPLFDPPVQP